MSCVYPALDFRVLKFPRSGKVCVTFMRFSYLEKSA